RRCWWRFGSSLDLKRAHNPKVAGSNPAPATNDSRDSPLVSQEAVAFHLTGDLRPALPGHGRQGFHGQLSVEMLEDRGPGSTHVTTQQLVEVLEAALNPRLVHPEAGAGLVLGEFET